MNKDLKEIVDHYYPYHGGVQVIHVEEEIPRVSRREFNQYTSRYIKDLPVIVTRRGVDDFIVKEI